MADIRKIDRKTCTAGCQKERRRDLADRKKESREIWQKKKDRQKDTAGCQKERRRDLADQLAAAEKTSERLIVAEPEPSLPDEKKREGKTLHPVH